MPDLRFLFAGPVLMIGLVALLVIGVALAAMRNMRRLLAGLTGAVCGYIAPGTELGRELYGGAMARGACPDAAWVGPAIGAFVGAAVGVVAYESVRSRRAAEGEGSDGHSKASG